MNLGGQSPAGVLQRALDDLGRESLTLKCVSKWYRTPAYPAGTGPDFVNGVVLAETGKPPREVLDGLHRIEAGFGRVRDARWAPRVLDLDLISVDDLVLPDPETHAHWRALPPERQRQEAPDTLLLPHPRLQDRNFVLYPLKDVAPDWRHPATGAHIDDLLAALPDARHREISPLSA